MKYVLAMEGLKEEKDLPLQREERIIYDVIL